MMAAGLGQIPLPDNPYNPLTQPDWHDAFVSCKRLEAASAWATFLPDLEKADPEAIMLNTSPVVAGRTLGYALILAPNDVGRDCVAREIRACDDDPEIIAGLAHLYIYSLIRVCE